MTDKLDPTQADRDAAALIYKMLSNCENPEKGFKRAENARRGNMDDLPTVQAFARHRRQAERAALERAAKVADKHRCKPDSPVHRGANNTARLIGEDIRALAQEVK